MKPTDVLALIPVDAERRLGMPYTPRPEYSKIACSRCGCQCWIGPRQLAKAAEGVQYLCMVCIVREIGPDAALANLQHLGGP